MGVLTLLRFLVGDREAILRIAGDRHALWIGFVFVLSAGFAREYDGEDLLAEPWHLLLPLGGSLAAATVLFLLIHVTSYGKESVPRPSTPAYLSFLGLFWMTAPLAWLYAVPYERFMDKAAATNMNLATLGVVAVWRVTLMVRVSAVCTDLPVRGFLGAVLLIGSVAVATAFALGYGLIATMAGIREEDMEKRYLGLMVLSVVVGMSMGGWLILSQSRPGRGGWLAPILPAPTRPTWPLVLLVAASLLVWAFILPLTQPEQQRRRAFELALRAEDYQAAASLLRGRTREAFPPHWVPGHEPRSHFRPHVTRFWTREDVGMLLALEEQGGPAWAREVYLSRVIGLLESSYRLPRDDERSLNDAEVELMADALQRIPEGAAILSEARKQTKPPELKADENDKERFRAVSRYNNLRAILAVIDGTKGK